MGELQTLILAAHLLKMERRDVTQNLFWESERENLDTRLLCMDIKSLSTVALTSSSDVLAKKSTSHAAASTVVLNLYGAVFRVISTDVKSCLIERTKPAGEILRKGCVCAGKVVLGTLRNGRNYLCKMSKAEKNI